MPAGDKVGSIVQADLTMSGEFRPLDPSKMLSLPSERSEVYFRDWRLLGQRYVLVGQLSRNGDRIQARYELLDVNQEKRILGETAAVPASNMRSLAHHISDRVYEAITGAPAFFLPGSLTSQYLARVIRPVTAFKSVMWMVSVPRFGWRVGSRFSHQPGRLMVRNWLMFPLRLANRLFLSMNWPLVSVRRSLISRG